VKLLDALLHISIEKTGAHGPKSGICPYIILKITLKEKGTHLTPFGSII
jgi:hypothetical protein